MLSPYRISAPTDPLAPDPSISIGTRIRNWFTRHPMILIISLVITMLTGWIWMMRASYIHAEGQTMESVQRWARERNGQIRDCGTTTNHYFCTVTLPQRGNWRLVYDSFGDVQPFVIVPEAP